ncbi:MAG: hypothetical protein MRY83_14200 [Flavobacteriales bacterium]|nr:hypothetical protein [Flavobacteriales bacterium]
MAIVDFFESGLKKQVKGHVSNLVKLSLIDGLTSDEIELLENIASRLGLTSEELEEIKKAPEDYAINPPVVLEDKYKRLYHLVQMMLVDGFVDDSEIAIVEKYGIGIGVPADKLNLTISHMIGFAAKDMSVDEAVEMILN